MISYIGGKGRIGKWIAPQIPSNIETYVEGFSGMFWVFFNMDLNNFKNLKTVVYNDFNKLNSNLMKCARDYDTLYNELSKYPCQQRGVEDTPEEYKEMYKAYQSEIFKPDLIITEENSMEIASKYVYVLTQSFSGVNPEKANYVDYRGKYRCKVLVFLDKLKNKKFREHFDKISFVENGDFSDVVKKYDSETTYFYMDPPYWKRESYYSNHDFDSTDHERLAETLKGIKGFFGLSYYDFPKLTEWYPADRYTWVEKGFTLSAGSKKDWVQRKNIELFIRNY